MTTGIRLLHGAIVALLLGEALYCAFEVMVVLQPPGPWGPLGFRAQDVPMDVLVSRRLYAIEGWIAFSALVLYLGVTEIAPRLRVGGRPR